MNTLLEWVQIEMENRAHYQDLLRKAAHERLVHEAFAGRQSQHHIVWRVLDWLKQSWAAWQQPLPQAAQSVKTHRL